MMMLNDMHESLKHEFTRRARRREEERTLERDRERKKEHERERTNREDALLAETALLTLASHQQLAEFNTWLDDYDTSLVEMLMENERRLTELRDQKNTLLDEAHVLPDGTRVLRMTDGETVIDEHGNGVSPEVVRWDHIHAHHPYGDDLLELNELESTILEHNAEIHRLQDQSASARDRAANDDVTESDLEAMRAELDAARADVMSRQPGAELAPEPEQPDHATNAPAQNLPTMGL